METRSSDSRVHGRRRAWLALSLGLLLLWPTSSPAHFLWLTAEKEQEKGAPVVRAFLSETTTPDTADLLAHIKGTKLTAGGKALTWSKDNDTYRVGLPETKPRIIDGFCDMGVMKRKDVTVRLLYTARVQWGPASADESELKDLLRVRLVSRPGKKPVVITSFEGRPVEGAIVKAIPEKGDAVELKTDADGGIDFPGILEGQTALLAKWFVKAPGTADGKAYDETRYYATLTVAPGTAEVTKAAATLEPFANMPEAVNSFGGAVLGDWLYVYSGHTGKMHHYHVDTTSRHFRRLNLKDRTTWEELPPGPPLQGVTLVANGGKLYRVGGMSAKNQPGKPNDLVSVADFASFDPETKTWTNLPALPAPRSTHDAVVLDNKLYVLGGWSMNGGDASNSEFCEHALVFDLTRPDSQWEALPATPFHRRALAAATVDGKIYVIGGLTDESKVSKSVDIYHPADKSWSQGPELPGSKLEGFAPSAFGINNRLYVSGKDGDVYRLKESGDGWETIGKLAVPRLTHRLLPGISHDLLVVGGTSGRTSTAVIESVPLNKQQAASATNE